MKGKKVIITAGIIVVILMLLFSLFTSLVKNVDNSVSQLSPEQRRSASYHVLEDKDAIVEDTDDNLTFSAFFTRNDESGTDKAQQVDGTCNKINSKDTLFLHLNLKDSGTLKNGKITITGNNFDYSMFMVKNDVLKESYLSDDVTEILLEDIKPGTDEIIFGDVISDIADNINNYSRQSTITLTGDYAKDGEEETVSIKKECNITVDWYGDIKAELKASKHTYYYDNRTSNKITFGFYVNETIKELLLGDVIATAEIPKLNGQDPVTAECTDSTIVDEYNSETRILTMKRSSTLDDEGNITKTLSRQNYFTVTVTYPDEAFENFDTYTQLQVKVNGKYTGYNNPNDEFVKKDESSDEDKEDTESSGDAQDTNKINLVESNLAEGVIILEFTETPEAEAPAIYSNKFSVSILNKIYVSRPSYRYIMSKQDILNLYDNNVENIENFKYTVRWQAYSGNADEIDSYIMTETKSSNETDPYGDKFDSAVIDEYTSNTGIYFFNATTALGEDGKILVYDDDSNQLLYTFTKDNWDSYNENTVFGYDTPVKHIRIETSKPLENEYLYVYHTKEIDTEKLIQKYSFEDMKAVSKLNTYLTGVANLANENKKTTNTYDDVYLVSETSQAKISVEQEKIQTQDTTNQEIYIETIHSQQGDSYWKNGQFIVELPDNIVKLDINKVTIDKQGVEVVAYEAYKKDGRYLIKIMTKNNEPTTYKITIDCDITPDSRIATKDEIITLYAYNENCNEYYSHVPDKYDVDNDIINDEEVGTANCKMRLIAPTSLITLETISDYDAEQNGEITIAPNVADVDKDERQAKINISLTNSYPFPVTGIKILGRIPFKDNKYIVNNKVDMKSEFDTIMVDGGIKATDNEILSKMKVYYTANPNPTQELTNQDNGWQELGEDDDFSKVKCYLIVLQDYTITNNKKVDLNYDVSLPEGIAYNQVSYSNHAVYFDFVTDGGKIPLYAEPAKVGVKIVDKFDLKLIKHKINSDLKIPGVTYSLNYQEEDTEGELQDKTRIITTRQDGSVTVEDLHADVDYTLKEIQVPDTCELSTEEFTFKIDKDGKLTYKGNNGTAVFDGSDVLTIELSDEIKANLQITKTKIGSSEQKINNVRFALIDDEGNKKTDSTKNGTLTFTGLSLNKKYTLTETSVPGGIALNTGKYEFKLIRETESGNIVIHNEGESSLISGNATITEEKDVLTPTMSVSVQDELRYSLDLTKVDDSGNLVQGVQFVLKGEGQKEEGSKYTTTKSGKINITGLHVGAEYTLEEVKALGYYLDNKEEHKITFKVTRNGKLEISKMEEEGIQFDGAVSISEVGLEANISLKLKNDKIPTYNLNIIKKNDNGDTLAGAQFKLRSEDTGIEQYITIDDEGNGTFKDLYEYIPDKYITGKYVLTETYAPEGYKLNPAEVKFFAQRNKDTGKLELTLEKDGGIASVVVEDENGESEEDGESKVDLENKTENEDEQETEAEGKTETNTESNTDPKDEKEDSNSENELKDVETLKISIVNEPIFNLIKLGDEDKPLPGATFTITKINEDDTETPAQTVDGTVLGEIKTDANGKISANLPEGFYKAVETEAPEGYLLPDDENERTYYFGIDMSKPAETSGQLDTVEWARSVSSDYVTKFKSAVKTSDGGVIAVHIYREWELRKDMEIQTD